VRSSSVASVADGGALCLVRIRTKQQRLAGMNQRIEHIGDTVTLYLGDCLDVLPTLDAI